MKQFINCLVLLFCILSALMGQVGCVCVCKGGGGGLLKFALCSSSNIICEFELNEYEFSLDAATYVLSYKKMQSFNHFGCFIFVICCELGLLSGQAQNIPVILINANNVIIQIIYLFFISLWLLFKKIPCKVHILNFS